MCETGDVTALSRHIQNLMSDDDLCRTLGTRALARAAAEFTPETHLQNLERAYERGLLRAR
jgi:glycosyltransferase involved in cell wall biosynthesis